MSIAREPIHAALFERFNSLPQFVTRSRRLLHWADTPAEMQPALFQATPSESVAPETGRPTKLTLRFDVYIYVKVPQEANPSARLNELLDAVAGALEPDEPQRDRCTLGGLVYYARIAGRIETDEGTLGDQAVAIVPVEVLTTY